MRHLLATRRASPLAALAGRRVLLAFDFDGTLAPLVADRDRARLRASTRALLTALCRRHPCAVVSGRATRDVAARLRGVGLRHVVGNHGADLRPLPAATARALRRARRALAPVVAAHRGVELEDKGRSLAIHVRHAAAPRAALRAIARALEPVPRGLRVTAGIAVVNVVPAGGRDKGHAVAALLGRVAGDVALYIGDDVTDEDVFRRGGPTLLTVRIGRHARSAAAYYLRDQREIDRVLRALLALPAGTGRR